MKEEKFELIFTPYRLQKKYRMQVEVIHRSDRIIRFKLTGGDKYIVMEKLLGKKTGNWKLGETNFEFSNKTVKQTSYTIFELQNILDNYLNKDNQRPTQNPKYEH
ncbi:MAG: hypothetical protein ABUT20_00875 [Bacteroidota bacterium]